MEDMIKKLMKRSERVWHHIRNKTAYKQTSQSYKRSFLFTDKHTDAQPAGRDLTVELNTPLASFSCMQSHTHVHCLLVRFKALSTNEGLIRHVHLVPSQI